MPLPPRQEYDPKGAAAYLGCGTEDVLYYLHKGMLRLAIATDYLDFDYLAPLKYAEHLCFEQNLRAPNS